MRRFMVVAGTVLALALPASAGAATIAVDGSVLRYAGDADRDYLMLGSVYDGELVLETTATPGPGCRERDPSTEPGPWQPGNRACSVAGLTRFDLDTGDGNDELDEMGGFDALPVPLVADMGNGGDRISFATIYDDRITLGDGPDSYVDAPGDDYVDAGPGEDTVYGGNFSTGDDTIIGGDGDDNLDGIAGNDTIDAGPGNDILQPGEGDDVLDGGDGDDYVAGDPNQSSTSCGESGSDVLRGGGGNDDICASQGAHTIDGGAGADAISSIDGAVDTAVACGAGTDVVWAEPGDPVAIDCERQGQAAAVSLSGKRVLPVPLPCRACGGRLSLFVAPGAATPEAGVFPTRKPAKVSGKALAKKRFKKPGARKGRLQLKLSKAAAARLRKLGSTTLEARATVRGRVLRRTFPLKR